MACPDSMPLALIRLHSQHDCLRLGVLAYRVRHDHKTSHTQNMRMLDNEETDP